MYLNPSLMIDLGRARQREILEHAERDRLASELRHMARATRQARRAARRHSAGWRIALRPSARLQ
jgi:hypothetical protein